jgi:DNA (cytosine-5)-methyltransferase 1
MGYFVNVLDLFSGIGGFSLGLERAGMRTVAFCEIDPYCRAVLRKHWPDVPVYDDVRTLTAARLAADVGDATGAGSLSGAQSRIHCREEGAGPRHAQPERRGIDVICGGFPCQDISVAGKGAGLAGERSGLWSEYARIIGEIRPKFIIVENVAALLHRGLGDVLGDLAALGYDAEWHCIPASAIGAPHRRDRLWIVAYPVEAMAHPNGRNQHWRGGPLQMGWGGLAREIAKDGDIGRTQWGAEPDVGRVAHGIPARVDRLCGLGNAVVPQIPEIIGRAIMNAVRMEQIGGAA